MDFFENDLQFSKIIFRDQFYYPPEINASIYDLISYFRANIVSNTPFIYLFAPNHIKTIIAYFAIIKSGHVCVLVEPDIGRLELAEMKQDTPPCALVHIDRVTDTFDYGKEIVFTHDNPQEYDWDELSDVATIVYTNAEDGYAKGAMLTRKNLLANAFSSLKCNSFDQNSMICALLPFNHLFGLQTGFLSPLLASSIVDSSLLIFDFFQPSKIHKTFNDIINFNATHLCSIPIIYYLLLKAFNKNILPRNIKLCSGGYKLSESISNHFFNKTNKIILDGYGLTEAGPVCSWYADDDIVKRGSVGKFVYWCRIRIANESDIECPIGHVGEICIKGDNVMKGYYKNKKATQKTIKKGWLHTMDLGKIDSDGYLYLTNLKKRMLNVNGRKVYIAEVERLLRMNNNVIKADIFGEPHPFQNNIVKAIIDLKTKGPDQENSFKKWAIDSISHYKIPKTIIFT
jgi:long-chain acyl-CoA synthetase